MGWASGSELAEDIWGLLDIYVAQKNKKHVASKLIKLFELHDCDTLYECTELIKAAKLEKEYFQDDDSDCY